MYKQAAADGLQIHNEYLNLEAQQQLLNLLQDIIQQSPFFTPISPFSKKPMGTLMSNAGSLGWCADIDKGFRYEKLHPTTHKTWPKIPQALLDIWFELTNYELEPECCLINYYNNSAAKLGLHKDHDEDNLDAPILSISLGDTCKFRIGTGTEPSPTQSFDISSGTAMVMGGKTARNAYHGVDKIYLGSNDLLTNNDLFKEGGRLSLTLRRVSL